MVLTRCQKMRVGEDGGDGADTLVDDGAPDGVGVVGALEGLIKAEGGGSRRGGDSYCCSWTDTDRELVELDTPLPKRIHTH